MHIFGANEWKSAVPMKHPENNMPVVAGLLGIWNSNFFSVLAKAILPYDRHPYRFSYYIRQPERSILIVIKNEVDQDKGPVIFGPPNCLPSADAPG